LALILQLLVIIFTSHLALQLTQSKQRRTKCVNLFSQFYCLSDMTLQASLVHVQTIAFSV